MYSLDVNFLRDRATPTASGGAARAARPKQVITLQDLLPAIIGGGVGLGLLAIAGGTWGFLFWQQTRVQNEIANINAEITANQPLVDEINQLEQQIQQANQQTQGLATVFQQIKPWSAILQDIRDRVPAGVRLNSVVAKETAAPQPAAAPSPAPSPPPGGQPAAPPSPAVPQPTIDISGTGTSFSDVNDFMLALRESLFLQGDTLQLIRATLQQPNIQVEGGNIGGVSVELPEVADFTISVQLADFQAIPVTDLRRELTRKGALGLAVRLETLETQGIIETQAPAPDPAASPAQPIIDPAASPPTPQ